MMDWPPIAFAVFKVLALGAGMFFAIKWHYDQGKMGKEKEPRAVSMAAAAFALLLLGLGVATFAFAGRLGLDLTFP